MGLLAEVVESLPAHRPLREANIYTAIDGDLVVDVFEFDDVPRTYRKFLSTMHPSRVQEINALGSRTGGIGQKDRLVEFLECCDEHYVLHAADGKIHEFHSTSPQVHPMVFNDHISY